MVQKFSEISIIMAIKTEHLFLQFFIPELKEGHLRKNEVQRDLDKKKYKQSLQVGGSWELAKWKCCKQIYEKSRHSGVNGIVS